MTMFPFGPNPPRHRELHAQTRRVTSATRACPGDMGQRVDSVGSIRTLAVFI